jgi:hypothetical protein
MLPKRLVRLREDGGWLPATRGLTTVLKAELQATAVAADGDRR